MRARRARLALGFVVVALCVAGRAASAQDIACDRGDIEVRRVNFEGNESFSDAELANGIVTTASGWARRVFGILGARHCLDTLAVRADPVRLALFYRRHGFSGGSVTTQIDTVRRNTVDVTFRIREGEPVILREMTINGLDSVPRANRITADLEIRVGERFDEFAVEASRDTILRRLRDNGYPKADVLRSFQKDTANLVATLRFDVATGPRAWIGAVNIDITPREGRRGGPELSQSAVRRTLGVDPGDLYRERELEAAKRALYLSDAYRHVEVSPDTASLGTQGDSTIDVDITLAESYMRSVRALAGWATLDCFRTQIDYADVAFLGGLRRLDVSARASKIGLGYPTEARGSFENLCAASAREDIYSDTLNYYVGATLRQSSLFGVRAIPSVTLYSELRSEYKVFRRYTPIGTIVSLNQPLGRLSATYAYQLEYGRTTAEPAIFCGVIGVCDVDEQQLLRRTQRLATASITLGRDRRDDPLNPTRGSAATLELRHAGRLIGSDPDLQFDKAVADATWYWGLSRNAVLVARLRGGVVFGQRIVVGADTTVFIPQQERLYAGGANSVRGYRQNELGPVVYLPDTLRVCTAPTGDCVTPTVARDTVYFRADTSVHGTPRTLPVGGNTVVVANVELRMPSPFLPERLQLAFFADAGQVWTRGASGAEQGFKSLRITPGLGVRVASPVGPIRVDVGYNPKDPQAGAAYFDAPVSARGGPSPLYCVSPGNALPVTGWRPGLGPNDPPPVQATSARGCPTSYTPPERGGLFRRLTFHVSIGQAF
jgi:outer membrane protein insertion porin family/translocation and assembly module TamA